MIVCGHGDVAAYCEDHEMIVIDTYTGDIEKYDGVCPVLITDQDMTETEYYFLKGKMLAFGKELIHTKYGDNKLMAEYAKLSVETLKYSRKEKHGGRCRFGFQKVNGEEVPVEKEMAVVRRILKLRDAGYTYRAIQADKDVRRPDGGKFSQSTLQVIVKNRERYGL